MLSDVIIDVSMYDNDLQGHQASGKRSITICMGCLMIWSAFKSERLDLSGAFG